MCQQQVISRSLEKQNNNKNKWNKQTKNTSLFLVTTQQTIWEVPRRKPLTSSFLFLCCTPPISATPYRPIIQRYECKGPYLFKPPQYTCTSPCTNCEFPSVACELETHNSNSKVNVSENLVSLKMVNISTKQDRYADLSSKLLQVGFRGSLVTFYCLWLLLLFYNCLFNVFGYYRFLLINATCQRRGSIEAVVLSMGLQSICIWIPGDY